MSDLKSFDSFLEEALYGKEGFYENECLDDHFITPSIAGEPYSQIIARYAQEAGLQTVYEYGAGTGALAKYLAPKFSSYHIIEKSSHCRSQQQQVLKNLSHISWHTALNNNQRCLVLLQEVFDCLPEKICYFDHEQAFEVFYDTKTDCLRMLKILKKDVAEHYHHFLNNYVTPVLWQHKQKFILPTQARLLLESIYNSVCRGTQLLIIDYGYSQPELAQKWSDALPLRTFHGHHLTPFSCKEIVKRDITYDVDFYYLCQCWTDLGGEVLSYEPLGSWIAKKIHYYDPLLKILTEPRFMGSCFKVLILCK